MLRTGPTGRILCVDGNCGDLESAEGVGVIAVSVVLYFQRAGIQYINSSAGKQVRIFIIAHSIRVGGKIRL